jgi:hypothetical protein
MWVHFDAAAGRFPAALAYTPHFNHAVHEVDASGLKVEDGRLRGRLAVTVLPDPYVPKERQPIACVYTIDARTADGGLAGRFHGAFGPEAVAGTVAGQYRPRQELAGPLAISLKMEEGVTGGPPWHNRSYIAFTLDGGKARRGSFANNKDAWTGTFDRADLGLVDGLLAGTIDCTVRTGRVKLGTYTFTLDGHVVGDQLMGDYTSQLDGRVVKSGKFMGTLRPAE